MAEYYPLLDRAVSGLPEQTPEARRSIYERARGALLGQLRGMKPAIPESDIQRESAALDEAIARIESRFPKGKAADETKSTSDTSTPPIAPAPPSREPSAAGRPTATERASAATPIAQASPSPPPSPKAPASEPRGSSLPIGNAPAVPPPAKRATPGLSVGAAPPVNSDVRPGAPAPVRTPATARGERPIVPLRPANGAADRGDARNEAPNLPRAPLLPPGAVAAGANRRAETAAVSDQAASDFGTTLDSVSGRASDAPATTDLSLRPRPAPALRPAAPRPAIARRLGRPGIVTAAAVAVLMIGIGIAAWRLRDRPEQVVASHPEIQIADGSQAAKVAERAPTSADAAAAATPGSADASGEPTVAAEAPDTNPAVPVAQRAALLIDAPDEPQRVKTYTGTVVWHLDSVSAAAGQALVTAVRADIDIPDAKLKVTMQMQRNPEPQLPASHTMELRFRPQPGNTLGNVKQVNVPEMRNDEAASGDPLAGVPVAITENYFLVGLQRGASEEQNMRLIAERNWFDMTILFSSSKFGKLTFEKGAAGERVFQDAMKAWR